MPYLKPVTSKINKELLINELSQYGRVQPSIKELSNKYSINYSTLIKFIKKELNFSYRKCSKISIRSLNPSYKNCYIELIQAVSDIINKNGLIIFIDESSFNNYKYNSFRWVSKQKASITLGPKNQISMNLLLATTKDEIFTYSINTRSNNAEEFLLFIKRVLSKILLGQDLKKSYNNNNVYIFVDNARIHHSKLLMSFLKQTQLNIVYIPPYSPELNLCELVFSYLKCKFYRSYLDTK